MTTSGYETLVPLSIGVGLGLIGAIAAARAGPKPVLRLIVGVDRLCTPKIEFPPPRPPPVEGVSIIHELSSKNIDQLVEMYQQEWWTKDRNRVRVKNMVRYTAVTIGLVNENKDLIGFVRGRTDAEFNTTVSDVIVRKDSRKQGLGVYLMDLVLAHPLVKNIERIDLYGKRDVQGVYEKVGFRRVVHVDLMRLERNCFDKLDKAHTL